MNCLILTALLLHGQIQCKKIHMTLNALVFQDNYYRGAELLIECRNPDTGETFYFGSIDVSNKCIKVNK